MANQQTILEANQAILTAIKQCENIQPAGKTSLMAIAAKAVDPEGSLSLRGIAKTLGLHPSVVIGVTVTADLAGESDARKELGTAFFERVKLCTHAPTLTPSGRLLLALWGLRHLTPAKDRFENQLLEQVLTLVEKALQTRSSSPAGTIHQLQTEAEKLQRNELVGVSKPGSQKERLGISDEQRFLRHAGQAFRATLQGVADGGNSVHLTTTVFGELIKALEAGFGLAAAAGLALELTQFLGEEFPEEHVLRPPKN